MHAFKQNGVGSVSLALGMGAAQCLAQATGESRPNYQPTEIEEVIITAQKRMQRNVDVGLQVSSLDHADLRGLRIEQVRDVATYLPNVDIKEQVPGAIPVVSIRGVGLDDYSSTNSPAAGIYVDEVPLSSLALMSFDLFDVERVEVIKGPQGTLYGRNSTAGAVTIVNARPQFERKTLFSAGYGSYHTRELEAVVNLPFGNAFALRFAGKGAWQDEGFWSSRRTETGGAGRRRIGERDVANGRVQAAWQAGDQVLANIKFERLRQRSEMGQPEFFGQAYAPGFEPIDPAHCTDTLGYTDTDGDPYKGDWVGEVPYHIDQNTAVFSLTADFGRAVLTAITGHVDMERQFRIDSDASPANGFNFLQRDDIEQISQEVRLVGSLDALDWQVGLFYSRDDVQVAISGSHNDLLPFMFSQTRADQQTRSGAGFASLDWHLAEPLVLVAGLRYTRESRDYRGGTTWAYELPGFIVNTALDKDIDDDNWSWRLGLNYSPSHNTLLYASVAKGWKSGGFFSGMTLAQDQLLPYEPESLLAYEIGVKTQGTFTVSASVFYYDYKNVQIFMRTGDTPVQSIRNVEGAELYGADLDLVWLPLRGLRLKMGVGWLETELGSFVGSAGNRIAAGNEMPNAPGTTLNALARYQFALGSGDLQLALQVDAHYAGEAFKESSNDPLIAVDSHTLYNARVTLFADDGKWELAAWGKNLGNEQYVVQGLNARVFFSAIAFTTLPAQLEWSSFTGCNGI